MILVDTSVWVEHLRRGQPSLQLLLDDGQVFRHPFVAGELACGTMRDRAAFFEDFNQLPSLEVAEHDEVMHLVEVRRLAGLGITWIDVHLLASALIAGAQLWTLDKRLEAAARQLRVAATLP